MSHTSSSLLLSDQQAEALKVESQHFPSLTLSRRQLCDLEMLLNRAFRPLQGFLGPADYEAVLDGMRLVDGTLWPVPVTLDIGAALAEKLAPGDHLALRDPEGFMPAVLEVSAIWQPDKRREAEAVYGGTDPAHPGVRYLFDEVQSHYVAGRVLGIQSPLHHDYEDLWLSPAALAEQFQRRGWNRVLAFQTSRPIHRLQRDLVVQAAKDQGCHILIHPTAGMTKPKDLHYYARVRCYQAVMQEFPHSLASLALTPLAMRMAGPREALWHALIQQNYHCSHFLVGPDHASPPSDSGQFYQPVQAQRLLAEFADELNIEVLPVEQHAYVASKRRFWPVSRIASEQLESSDYGERNLREDLHQCNEPPAWFSFPAVLEALRGVYPPKSRQGFTLFFTGLSGSGKSTLAKIVYAKLIEDGRRPVTLLDGDIVRMNLSSELGFSKAHRDLNIRRIGFVANEISKNGGIAICAPIAPYRSTRRAVREMIEEFGAFIEVHVCTALEVCESRDRKGLYAKARKGLIPEFTGISDPYEVPERPELRIDTADTTPMAVAQEVMLYLLKNGYLDD